MDYLSLIGRDEALFEKDLDSYNDELVSLVSKARFLVIGGAGSIGQLVGRGLPLILSGLQKRYNAAKQRVRLSAVWLRYLRLIQLLAFI